MSDSLTFQRTLRLHLGLEQAEWLRHETVTRFADGQEAVVSMEFEQVAPDVAMQYPAVRRWCDEQTERNAVYHQERKQGRGRGRTAPRPKPQPRWLTELAPQPEAPPQLEPRRAQPEPQPEAEPEVVPEVVTDTPRRGKPQIRPFDWAAYEHETDGKL